MVESVHGIVEVSEIVLYWPFFFLLFYLTLKHCSTKASKVEVAKTLPCHMIHEHFSFSS